MARTVLDDAQWASVMLVIQRIPHAWKQNEAKLRRFVLGSRSRDTRVESVAQISGLQKVDFRRVSMTWRGSRLAQSPP